MWVDSFYFTADERGTLINMAAVIRREFGVLLRTNGRPYLAQHRNPTRIPQIYRNPPENLIKVLDIFTLPSLQFFLQFIA